jgi:pyruvate dehydrogenase E1 component beta subunit
LIVADTGWTTGGFSAEVVSLVSEHCWQALKTPPKRMALLDVPTPSTVALAKHCYPRAFDLVREVSKMLGLVFDEHLLPEPVFSDVPDESFKGPF